MSSHRRRLVILKTPAFAPWAAAHCGRLPYGIDALRDHGFELRWTDAHLGRPWTSRPLRDLVRLVERTGTHVVQTLLLAPHIVRAPTTLAMFESEGHFLALVRSFLPARLRRRHKLVIVACWLSEIAPGLSARKLRLYRRLYRY